jgi:hypothetical protein
MRKPRRKGKTGEYYVITNLDMYRPGFKPRPRKDEFEQLRAKYLKNTQNQVKDSIK